jgi:hypothetical protein
MENKFLKDFLFMRQKLNEKPEPVHKRKDDKKPSLHGLPVPTSAGLTLGYIIKEEPPRKEVIEYLRERVNQIMEEDEM